MSRIELIDTGVDVSVISPGFVQSEIRLHNLGADATPTRNRDIVEDNLMTAEECARQILNAIVKRKRDLIIVKDIRLKFVELVRFFAPKYVDKTTQQSIRSGKT